MIALTRLELGVLEMLLVGEDEMLVALREQLESASVTERVMSGVGFFTTLQVGKYCTVAKDRTFKLGDVIAEMSGLENGAGFLVYVENGVLAMIEGYTYDEDWVDTSKFKLHYVDGKRDLEFVRIRWS